MEGATSGLSTDEVETSKWNPLQCRICSEQYREPCILECYHSFCGACIADKKDQNNNVSCPLCGSVTVIKEGSDLPPPDPLLKYLVQSSFGDRVTCANCDQTCSQMYFCNTCTQPLCLTCREETHRAKMFQRHEIVLHTNHTRDIQKECKIHGEPYILFSTEKKLMLCINCFRDMKIESRSHCVDLETAYKQGCQKLDDTMQSIRDLQSSVRDCILLLRALLEEIETNVDTEKQSISELFNTMQEKITETKEALLTEIDRQYAEKEKLFKNQLVSLTTFLPTLHVHLVTCAAFSSSTNKYEFLDFTYVLMKRLTAIIQVQHPLHPSQTSDIVTEYKAKFAQCLEPLLLPPRNGNGITTPVSIASSVASTRYEPSPALTSLPTSVVAGMSPGHTSQPPGSGTRNYHTKKFKLKLMETKGFFSDHCKEFDDAHRELMLAVEGLKQGVQEVQRDITLRRSLTKDLALGDLRTKIDETEVLLDTHHTNVENKQTGLQQHWEDALERIAGEQEVYKAQLQDVGRLKGEVASVKTILQRLSSFVSSIANVTQRLAPKLSKATTDREQKDQHSALLNTISAMQPDSQHRVDAIRTAQEERDIKTANRPNPLDEELIKTKGLLRAPSARKDSSSKRSSAEIRDFILDTDDKECLEKEPSHASECSEVPQEFADERQGIGKSDGAEVEADASDDRIHSVMTFSNVKADYCDIEKSPSNKADAMSTDSGIGIDTDSVTGQAHHGATRDKLNGHGVNATLEAVNKLLENEVDAADGFRASNKLFVPETPIRQTSKYLCDKIPRPVSVPDVAMQFQTKDEESDKLTTDGSDVNGGSDVSAEFSVDIPESEFDSSLDLSSSSLDDGIKEGHVKDIITKVDERAKGAIASGTTPKSLSPRSDKLFKLNQEDRCVNGAVDLSVNGESRSEIGATVNSGAKMATPSSVNGAVDLGANGERIGEIGATVNSGAKMATPSSVNGAVDLSANGERIGEIGATMNSGAKMAAPSSVTTSTEEKRQWQVVSVNGVEYDRVNQFVMVEQDLAADAGNQAAASGGAELQQDKQGAGEDTYVPKSLPELAQVFEPGELKQKKRRKSEKDKLATDA